MKNMLIARIGVHVLLSNTSHLFVVNIFPLVFAINNPHPEQQRFGGTPEALGSGFILTHYYYCLFIFMNGMTQLQARCVHVSQDQFNGIRKGDLGAHIHGGHLMLIEGKPIKS